jgi:hypothetical protein
MPDRNCHASITELGLPVGASKGLVIAKLQALVTAFIYFAPAFASRVGIRLHATRNSRRGRPTFRHQLSRYSDRCAYST